MARRPRYQLAEPSAEEITAHRIAEIWHHAAKRGPYPDVAACQEDAELLMHHRGHGNAPHAVARRNAPAVQAIKTLLKSVDTWLEPFELGFELPEGPVLSSAGYNVLHELRASLKKALPVFDPFCAEPGPVRPVWEDAAILAHCIAKNRLDALGRTTGITENSVAVRFATEATKLMGFSDVTAAGITNRLEALGKTKAAAIPSPHRSAPTE